MNTERRLYNRRAVTTRAKIEFAMWIAATALVSFCAGIYFTSEFIGSFMPELAR